MLRVPPECVIAKKGNQKNENMVIAIETFRLLKRAAVSSMMSRKWQSRTMPQMPKCQLCSRRSSDPGRLHTYCKLWQSNTHVPRVYSGVYRPRHVRCCFPASNAVIDQLTPQAAGSAPQLLQDCLKDMGHKSKEWLKGNGTSTCRRVQMNTASVLCDQVKGILLAGP